MRKYLIRWWLQPTWEHDRYQQAISGWNGVGQTWRGVPFEDIFLFGSDGPPCNRCDEIIHTCFEARLFGNV